MKGCKVLQSQEIKKSSAEFSIRDKLLCLSGLYFGDVSEEYLSIKNQKNSENVTLTIGPEYKKTITDLRKFYKSCYIEVTPDTFLFLSREGYNRPIYRTRQAVL